MNSFTITGKKALLDLLAARPLKAALYTEGETELPAEGGYETGGLPLTNARTDFFTYTDEETGAPVTVATLTFDDVTWQNAAFTGARYLRIYDGGTTSVSSQNRSGDGTEPVPPSSAIASIDFGSDKSGQGADFTYRFPRQGGLIRI